MASSFLPMILPERATRQAGGNRVRRSYRRHQDGRFLLPVLAVAGGDVVPGFAAGALAGDGDDRASEPSSSDAGAVDVRLLARQLDEVIDLRNRDLEIVAQRFVRGVEELAEARQVPLAQGRHGGAGAGVLRDHVPRPPVERLGEGGETPEVLRSEIAELADAQELGGALALLPPDPVLS